MYVKLVVVALSESITLFDFLRVLSLAIASRALAASTALLESGGDRRLASILFANFALNWLLIKLGWFCFLW